jgi:hypothetical protein
MAPHVPISSLLVLDSNTETLRNVRPHVALVAGLLSHPILLLAPPGIGQ